MSKFDDIVGEVFGAELEELNTKRNLDRIQIPKKLKKLKKKNKKRNKEEQEIKLMINDLHAMMMVLLDQQKKIIKMIEGPTYVNVPHTVKYLSSDDDMDIIMKMRNEGIPVKKIASDYGVSPNTIYRRIAEYKKKKEVITEP